MGQASAALSTAAGQDLTAVGSAHTLTEAVLLGALTLLGLIGTEHLHTPPNKVCCAAEPHYSTAGGKNSPAVDKIRLTFWQASVIIHKNITCVNKNLRKISIFPYFYPLFCKSLFLYKM